MIEQEQVEIKTILFIILNFFTQANNHGDICQFFSTFVWPGLIAGPLIETPIIRYQP